MRELYLQKRLTGEGSMDRPNSGMPSETCVGSSNSARRSLESRFPGVISSGLVGRSEPSGAPGGAHQLWSTPSTLRHP
jgi:hypothetical protein